MSIPLKRGTNGDLSNLQTTESVQADLFERLAGSGNLLVGSTLGSDELRLGSTSALIRCMGDAQVDGILEISDNAPVLRINENDGGSNEKIWDLRSVGGALQLVTLTDALGAGDDVFEITRSGTTVSSIDFKTNEIINVGTINADAVYDNGNSTASFTWTLANGQHQEVTLNSDSVALTISTTGLPSDASSVYTLRVKQDATGSRAITSASISGGTVYYTGTTEPTFPTAASAQCEMVCKIDGTDAVCQVSGVLTAWT